MVRVYIPAQLQRMFQAEVVESVPPGTLTELLDALEIRYPGIRQRLCDERGELRRFVYVYVDSEDVRRLDGVSTRVADGARSISCRASRADSERRDKARRERAVRRRD